MICEQARIHVSILHIHVSILHMYVFFTYMYVIIFMIRLPWKESFRTANLPPGDLCSGRREIFFLEGEKEGNIFSDNIIPTGLFN